MKKIEIINRLNIDFDPNKFYVLIQQKDVGILTREGYKYGWFRFICINSGISDGNGWARAKSGEEAIRDVLPYGEIFEFDTAQEMFHFLAGECT